MNQPPPQRYPRSRYATARQLQAAIQQLSLIVNQAIVDGGGSGSDIPASGANYVFDGDVLKIKGTDGTNLRIDFVPDGSDYNLQPTT
jgi:hypothetical protein